MKRNSLSFTVILLCLFPGLWAQQDQAPGFNLLNSLVEEALRSNPSILAARKGWEAATKRPSQVSSLPNPELSISSMSGGNPLPFSTIGKGALDWASWMFMQSIPWPGKRERRGEIAATEANQQAQAYQGVTLDVVRQVKEAYFELYFVDRSREILSKNRRLLEQLSKIAEARYSVGQGPQQDVLKSQVEISLVIEQLEALAGRREAVESRINALLNRSLDVTLPSLVELEQLVKIPFSLEELYLRARDKNPEIQNERLGIQRASLQLDLAKKEFLPDFNVSAAYYQRGGPFDNMYEYRLGVQIPLYFWRKERFAVEENVAELQRSKYDFQSKLQDVTFRIKDSYISARTSERLVELYKRGIIPQAAASLDSALAGYQTGTIDFLTLTSNALTILNYEMQLQEEIRDYYQSLVRLEQLLGFVLVR